MAPVNDRWHVTVTREGRDWLAEVAELTSGAHTHARNLHTLDKHVREIIVLGADLPDDALNTLTIDYEYRVDEQDAERRRAVEERRTALRLAAEADQRYTALARNYVSRGLPVRDIAAMLGISHQRVSQLTAPSRPGTLTRKSNSAKSRSRQKQEAQ